MIFNFQENIKRYILGPEGLSEVNQAPQGQQPSVGYQSKGQYDPNEVSAVRDSIKYMESRGEQNPYAFSQPSGIKEFGDALGAYQITEAKLRENSRRFLGKLVNKDEFLNNPKLQDAFMASQIKYLLDNGFKVNSLFAAHRGGWSDMSSAMTQKRNKKYQQYMNEATAQYQKILQEREEAAKKMQQESKKKKSESKKEFKNKILGDLSEIKTKLNEPQEFDVQVV